MDFPQLCSPPFPKVVEDIIQMLYPTGNLRSFKRVLLIFQVACVVQVVWQTQKSTANDQVRGCDGFFDRVYANGRELSTASISARAVVSSSREK